MGNKKSFLDTYPHLSPIPTPFLVYAGKYQGLGSWHGNVAGIGVLDAKVWSAFPSPYHREV